MTINKKDEQFRQFALTAHPLRLLLTVCGPLAVYQALQQIFKILDTLMASHVSSEAVSAVAVLSQITLMITALGTGLAVGGCIKISEAYGKGDYDLVRQRTSTLYALALGISLTVAVILIPFIPVLWYLQQFTAVGPEAVGITMMVSNVATGVLSVIMAIPVLRDIRIKINET